MENRTATRTCSCQSWTAAGWNVRCNACRRGVRTPETTNVYELAARGRKAERLAELLLDQGATSAEAAELPEHARLIAAALAGVRRPSQTTWDLVVGLMGVVERNQEAEGLEEMEELLAL